MPAFKEPGFQERAASAAKARTAALEKLRAKPQLSEEEIAVRTAARLEREAADSEKRAAAKAAREEAAELARAAKLAAIPEPEPVVVEPEKPAAPVLTDEERKAMRDARYAARKKRKK